MNRKAAFTLIELLVVIAIIAILAAILFPVFAQAKAAAKKTADLSNQKNIGTAIMMYGADNDDMFPRHTYQIPGTQVGGWFPNYTWREFVMPYVKNGQQQQGTSAAVLAVNGIFETPAKPGARGAYHMNRNLAPGHFYWHANGGGWISDSPDGIRNNNPIFPSVSQTAVDAPAQVMMTYTSGINPDWNASGDFADTSWWWWGGAQWPPQFSGPTSVIKWDADSNVQPTWSVPRFRYTGTMNVAYADGHASSLQKNALNWCRHAYVKGLTTDFGENWDWLFDPGQPCAAFAR